MSETIKPERIVFDPETRIVWKFEDMDHPDMTCSGPEALCDFCTLVHRIESDAAKIRERDEQIAELKAHKCAPCPHMHRGGGMRI